MTAQSNRTYSSWLVPDTESMAHRRLQATITVFAERYVDVPVFDLQVMVISGIMACV